jgi:hypothetical protein
MGVNSYGAPGQPLSNPSLSAWAASIADAVTSGVGGEVDERIVALEGRVTELETQGVPQPDAMTMPNAAVVAERTFYLLRGDENDPAEEDIPSLAFVIKRSP